MKAIESFTDTDKYYANKRVLHDIMMITIFNYDNVNFMMNKNGFIFEYNINNIKLSVIGTNKNNKIGFKIQNGNEIKDYNFKGPKKINNESDYKREVFEYWDKLIYTIYLCATDKFFESKTIECIMKYFDFIYEGSRRLI